jgi:hypothetical protein
VNYFFVTISRHLDVGIQNVSLTTNVATPCKLNIGKSVSTIVDSVNGIDVNLTLPAKLKRNQESLVI